MQVPLPQQRSSFFTQVSCCRSMSAGLIEAPCQALQMWPVAQEKTIDLLHRPGHPRQAPQTSQPAPAWQGRPQGQEGLRTAQQAAIRALHMEARQQIVAGGIRRQWRVKLTDIDKTHRQLRAQRCLTPIDTDFTTTQRAAAIVEHGQCRSFFARVNARQGHGRCLIAGESCVALNQPFLAQALHQPAAATCLPANSGQPPALSPALP